MNDPYQMVFESFAKALTKCNEMIVWIAKRTLTAKDFTEFVEEFSEESDKDEVLDFIRKEDR